MIYKTSRGYLNLPNYIIHIFRRFYSLNFSHKKIKRKSRLHNSVLFSQRVKYYCLKSKKYNSDFPQYNPEELKRRKYSNNYLALMIIRIQRNLKIQEKCINIIAGENAFSEKLCYEFLIDLINNHKVRFYKENWKEKSISVKFQPYFVYYTFLVFP